MITTDRLEAGVQLPTNTPRRSALQSGQSVVMDTVGARLGRGKGKRSEIALTVAPAHSVTAEDWFQRLPDSRIASGNMKGNDFVQEFEDITQLFDRLEQKTISVRDKRLRNVLDPSMLSTKTADGKTVLHSSKRKPRPFTV